MSTGPISRDLYHFYPKLIEPEGAEGLLFLKNRICGQDSRKLVFGKQHHYVLAFRAIPKHPKEERRSSDHGA